MKMMMIGRYVQLSRRLAQCTKGDSLQLRKCMSSFMDTDKEEATVVSEDGNVIICWHPEHEFPYECTKPIPEYVDKSHLKVSPASVKDTFRKTHPYYELKMLQELTYTNKHIWFGGPQDKFIKFREKEPKDREYL